ncbi:MAG: hypothetical protein V2I65_12720 [Paracoccaceae bacterium]|jgi:hypothetical protein|nr:hypothetical protein [Paracoccaceae bacterium]
MPATPLPRRAPLLLAVALLAGCSEGALRDWNHEAGISIQTADFGNATMNNHLAQTCRTAGTSPGKAPVGDACAGRTLDGEYADAVYDGYVASAEPVPEVIGAFEEE